MADVIRLTRKQVAAAKRALARHGLKLPKPGYCVITTKAGGRYNRVVVSSNRPASEICHNYDAKGRVFYTARIKEGIPWVVAETRRGPRRGRNG